MFVLRTVQWAARFPRQLKRGVSPEGYCLVCCVPRLFARRGKGLLVDGFA